MIYDLAISESLLVTEAVRCNLATFVIEETLVLSESLNNNIHSKSISEQLFLTERLIAGFTISKIVSETISMVESVHPRAFPLTINETLAIGEDLNRNIIEEIISLSETLTFESVKTVSEQIDIVEELTATFHKTYTITEEIILSENIGNIDPNKCIPFDQINNHQVVLTSIPEPARTITLPSPDFDNAESLTWTRVAGETRGLDLILYRDADWPKTTVLKYLWKERLKDSLRKDLIVFLRRTIGQKLTLVDYEGRSFTVICQNPDADFSQRSRYDNSVELNFEVE